MISMLKTSMCGTITMHEAPKLVEGWEPNCNEVASGSELEDNNTDDDLVENSDSSIDKDEEAEADSSNSNVCNFSF